MVRYDAKSHQFVPFLSGISADRSEPSPGTDDGWPIPLTRITPCGEAGALAANACS